VTNRWASRRQSLFRGRAARPFAGSPSAELRRSADHLAAREQPFVILDARPRVGDAWRNRWDSLRLFTPARYCGLDGMPFPAPPHYFPTKDEMADYLESYAATFRLPVRTGTRVEALRKKNGHFVVETPDERFESANVVIAMSNWQRPRRPELAAGLDSEIRQIHSNDYRNPDQLRSGPVLVVGAGNSGAEIALDVVDGNHTWLSGPDTGHIPFRVESQVGRMVVPIVLRIVFPRVLTTSTPMGRRARPKSGEG